MSIPLPFLAQKVELYPSELKALRDALGHWVHQVLFCTIQLTSEEAYALPPLSGLHARLITACRRELPAGKAYKLRLEYIELVALRRQNAAIQAAGGDNLLLIGATGKVHQKTLPLDRYIIF